MNNFLKQFDCVSNSEAGATLHFNFNSGEPAFVDSECKKPLTVTMLGVRSKAHDAYVAQSLREHRAEDKKNRGKSKKEIEAEAVKDTFISDIVKTQTEKLVAVVTSWENFNDENNKPMPCTKENVRKVFSSCGDLQVQAINFLEDNANFTNG